jgi:hypothetical protein
VGSVKQQSDFLGLAAQGLAELGNHDPQEATLSLEMEVSIWMRKSGSDVSAARGALLVLRDALISVSKLDALTEPVPLPIADPQRALTNLLLYLNGLTARAANVTGLDRREVLGMAVSKARTGRLRSRRLSS